MAQKIYKVFLGKSSEAWHQLSKAEQDELMMKVNSALEQVGGKRLIMCNSYWSAEQWPFFGVEEFPDIEAQQKHSALLEAFNWGRYIDGLTVLGTEWQ